MFALGFLVGKHGAYCFAKKKSSPLAQSPAKKDFFFLQTHGFSSWAGSATSASGPSSYSPQLTLWVDVEEQGISGDVDVETIEKVFVGEEMVVGRQETVQDEDEAICPARPCVSPPVDLMWTEKVQKPQVEGQREGEEEEDAVTVIRPVRDLFEPLVLLGKGSYGKVVLARKEGGPDTGRLYAVKAIKKANIYPTAASIQRIWLESQIMGRLKHPFLVSTNYALQSSKTLFLVMEFVQGGNLVTILDTIVSVEEQQVKFYAAEITLALEFLHQRCIIYRDLKAENTMLDSRGHIKLTDFGLAKRLHHPTGKTRSFCGTFSYMAPEIVRRQLYGKEVDWWCLGILLYFILTGEMMFERNTVRETQRQIRTKSVRFSSGISRVCQSFLRQLLHKNPNMRLGRNANGGWNVKRHPFFNGTNWETVYQRLAPPPFIPDLNGKEDLSYFDSAFTNRSLADTVPTAASAQAFNGIDGRYFDDFDFVRENVSA